MKQVVGTLTRSCRSAGKNLKIGLEACDHLFFRAGSMLTLFYINSKAIDYRLIPSGG